jgi:hypothetical protein
VKIVFDDPDLEKFTIGAQGAAAIYTGGMHGGWAAMRRISSLKLNIGDQTRLSRQTAAWNIWHGL